MTTYYILVDSPESGESFVGACDDRMTAEARAMDGYARLGYPVIVYDSRDETVMACA